MSVTDNTTITSQDSVENVEEGLTKKAAEVKEDEDYLGVAAEADIVDVRVDDVDSDTAVEFDISLPNSKTGTIGFSNYEFKKGRVELFLENINCTVSDMKNAKFNSIPVTFTEHKGWITLIGGSKHLNSTYKGTSNWYSIRKGSGQPHPNTKYSHLLSLPLYISILISIYQWSGFPLVYGFAALGAMWYLNCMSVGMSMPKRKRVSNIKSQ